MEKIGGWEMVRICSAAPSILSVTTVTVMYVTTVETL